MPRWARCWAQAAGSPSILVLDLFTGMGGCWHALDLLGIPPGPDSGIKMLMYETDAASRSILAGKAASAPGHLVLSSERDSTGEVGSVLALTDNNCELLVRLIKEHPSITHLLVTGGSPCQGFSRANPFPRGVSDERSALIWVFHAIAHRSQRLLAGKASVAVVLENVVMHKDCKVPSNISSLLGVEPQLPNSKLWAHCDRDRTYWSSYRADPLPSDGDFRPDFSRILKKGWRPLWELCGDRKRSRLSTFLRPFPPDRPHENLTAYWKYPLHRYDEQGLVYLASAPRSDLDKIRGFVHDSIRLKDSDQLKHKGSAANTARRRLCDWIHSGGGAEVLRPPDAEERELALGFPLGASRTPPDFLGHGYGSEFERGCLTGNAWSPPAAAHVLRPLADHILRGVPLEVTLSMPDFVSKEATLRLIQPDPPPPKGGGRGRQ